MRRICLHESISSYASIKSGAQRREGSYHRVILRDGSIVSLAPYWETVTGVGPIYSKEFPGLLFDEVAIHICLESPLFSREEDIEHEGYTDAQYLSLVSIFKDVGISPNDIYYHSEIDETKEKEEPRSLSPSRLLELYNS